MTKHACMDHCDHFEILWMTVIKFNWYGYDAPFYC